MQLESQSSSAALFFSHRFGSDSNAKQPYKACFSTQYHCFPQISAIFYLWPLQEKNEQELVRRNLTVGTDSFQFKFYWDANWSHRAPLHSNMATQEVLGWDATKKLRLINCISFSDYSVFLPCWILRGQHWFLWLTVPHHEFKGKAAG